MLQQKGYKYRIYPNKKQQNLITPSIMKMQQAFSSYDSVSTTMEICSTSRYKSDIRMQQICIQ